MFLCIDISANVKQTASGFLASQNIFLHIQESEILTHLPISGL
jgi:hypothetical protein